MKSKRDSSTARPDGNRKSTISKGPSIGTLRSEAVTKLAVVAARAFCRSLVMFFYPCLATLWPLVWFGFAGYFSNAALKCIRL